MPALCPFCFHEVANEGALPRHRGQKPECRAAFEKLEAKKRQAANETERAPKRRRRTTVEDIPDEDSDWQDPVHLCFPPPGTELRELVRIGLHASTCKPYCLAAAPSVAWELLESAVARVLGGVYCMLYGE